MKLLQMAASFSFRVVFYMWMNTEIKGYKHRLFHFCVQSILLKQTVLVRYYPILGRTSISTLYISPDNGFKEYNNGTLT